VTGVNKDISGCVSFTDSSLQSGAFPGATDCLTALSCAWKKAIIICKPSASLKRMVYISRHEFTCAECAAHHTEVGKKRVRSRLGITAIIWALSIWTAALNADLEE